MEVLGEVKCGRKTIAVNVWSIAMCGPLSRARDRSCVCYEEESAWKMCHLRYHVDIEESEFVNRNL